MFKKIILISKRFKNVLAISDSIKCIEEVDITNINIKNYILGQRVNKLFPKFKKIFFDDKKYSLEKKEYVHKRFTRNVIISKPDQISPDSFESQVLINANSDEIADHLTGYHIPGMVIIEAARQIMLSVTERYYSDFDNVGDCYVIINGINAKLDKFLFPWDINIIFKINSITKLKNNNKFESTATFRQNNEICSEVNMCFSVFYKSTLLNIERRKAKMSLDKLQSNS